MACLVPPDLPREVKRYDGSEEHRAAPFSLRAEAEELYEVEELEPRGFADRKIRFLNQARAVLQARAVPKFLENVEVPWPFVLDLIESCQRGSRISTWGYARTDPRTKELEVEVLSRRASSEHVLYCWGPKFALVLGPSARIDRWHVLLWF
jgi:hypothetical protein